MIAIIDYGMGNLRSVSKAFETVGAKVEVTNTPKKISQSIALVLPGVGAFRRGMENLKALNLIPSIYKSIKENKPFLGICLGLQLLFTKSYEHGEHKGLDILPGEVKRFSTNVKTPHMGWNSVKQATSYRLQATGKNLKPTACSLKLFKDIPDRSYFYFVHSYYVKPEDENIIVATTNYGNEFVSAIQKGNIFGVQFHPEKSADLGLKVLKNFVNIVKKPVTSNQKNEPG